MGVRNAYQQAADYQNRIRSYYTPELPYILATEVLEEMARQCRSGKQYLTFPNRISAEEKAKLEAKNYIVTENTIQSKNRDGIGDEYIGFQVALNATAASDYRPMVISEEEINGISGGGGGGGGGSSAAPVFSNPSTMGSTDSVVGVATQGTIP